MLGDRRWAGLNPWHLHPSTPPQRPTWVLLPSSWLPELPSVAKVSSFSPMWLLSCQTSFCSVHATLWCTGSSFRFGTTLGLRIVYDFFSGPSVQTPLGSWCLSTFYLGKGGHMPSAPTSWTYYPPALDSVSQPRRRGRASRTHQHLNSLPFPSFSFPDPSVPFSNQRAGHFPLLISSKSILWSAQGLDSWDSKPSSLPSTLPSLSQITECCLGYSY